MNDGEAGSADLFCKSAALIGGKRKAAEFLGNETLRYTASEAPKGRDLVAHGASRGITEQ